MQSKGSCAHPALLTQPDLAAGIPTTYQTRAYRTTVTVRSADGWPMGLRHIAEWLPPVEQPLRHHPLRQNRAHPMDGPRQPYQPNQPRHSRTAQPIVHASTVPGGG